MRVSFILSLMLACSVQASALRVEHLRVQSRMNPQGIDEKSPLFSWQLKSDERGVVQTAYQLALTTDAEGETYHPTTTFYGFRYCEIAPADDEEILSCEAQPISSSVDSADRVQDASAAVLEGDAVYDLSGRKVHAQASDHHSQLPKGIYIVSQGSVADGGISARKILSRFR